LHSTLIEFRMIKNAVITMHSSETYNKVLSTYVNNCVMNFLFTVKRSGTGFLLVAFTLYFAIGHVSSRNSETKRTRGLLMYSADIHLLD
jgi:hypothetical protein